MQVIVNPYHRSVTIDGVEVVQKILEFPNELNHLSTISCTYDSNSKKITQVHDLHRFTSNFIEREYFFEHLPVFVDWFYKEKQAQIEDEAKKEQYKQDIEDAYNKTVQAGNTAVTNINTDKTEALNAIESSKTTTLNTITSKRAEALNAVQDSKIIALNEITNTTNTSINSITGTTNSGLNNLNSKENEALNKIATDKAEALSAILSDRQSSLDAINSSINKATTQADRSKTEADRSKYYADQVQAVADVRPATKEQIGLVIIGDNINVDERGVIDVPLSSKATQDEEGNEVPEVAGVVTTGKTITNTNGKLDVNLGDSLEVDDDGKINPKVSNVFIKKDDGTIDINLDSSIETDENGKISIKLDKTIIKNDDGSLNVNTDTTLFVSNSGKIGVNLGAGLEVDSNGKISTGVINVRSFGVKGDGVTDDTTAFNSLEASVTGKRVDLQGMLFAVSTMPKGNYYYNGTWIIGDSKEERPANNTNILAYFNPKGAPGQYNYDDELVPFNSCNNFILHNDIKPEEVEYAFIKNPEIPHLKQVIAIGPSTLTAALKKKTYLSDIIAIGSRVMSTKGMASAAQHNIGIGDAALWNLTTGDRNIAIGSTALAGCKDGARNIAIGRDTAWGLESGYYNTFVGVHTAGGGAAPITIDHTEHNLSPYTGNYNTVVGGRSAGRWSGEVINNTIIGSYCLRDTVYGNHNVYIGAHLAENLHTNVSLNKKDLVVVSSEAATYSVANNRITVSQASHQAVVGCYVDLTFTDGVLKNNDNQILYVESVSSSRFVLVIPYDTTGDITGSGNCSINAYEQSTTSNIKDNIDNIVIGARGLSNVGMVSRAVILSASCNDNNTVSPLAINSSTIIGAFGVRKAQTVKTTDCVGFEILPNADAVEHFVGMGYHVGYNATGECKWNVGIGSGALSSSTTVQTCVAVGYNTGKASTDGLYSCTAVGSGALNNLLDGTKTTILSNATALGYNASVSGNNQVQIGNSSTTVYVYGSVQNRSDLRDKTDVRNTTLGLSFINALRPVDFRWDMRDDYITTDEDGNVIKNNKDGSKKRNRYHHGLIAQEVKSVMDKMGVDFGGYQDHKINGGCDILSIGYEELIGPMIKSIQELTVRVESLETV